MDPFTDQLLSFDLTGGVFAPCSTHEMAIGRPRSMHRRAPGRSDPSQAESRL
jgi:hypothetical protein